MATAPVFTWKPDQGAAVEDNCVVVEAKFGDGYVQRAAPGLNSVQQIWTLSFTLRQVSEVNAIYSFLKACKGVSYFVWTTPFGETLKFTCKKFSRTANYSTNAALSATFEQVFDL